MRKLLFALALLLYTGAHAQKPLQVSLGYGVSTADEMGYGKAYLSIGGSMGATLFVGGDSRIKYGGEERGRGWLGGAFWMDIIDDRDWSVKPFLGLDYEEDYVRVVSATGVSNASIFASQSRKVNTDWSAYAGVTAGWKFMEVTITNKKEIFFGIKLTR